MSQSPIPEILVRMVTVIKGQGAAGGKTDHLEDSDSKSVNP